MMADLDFAALSDAAELDSAAALEPIADAAGLLAARDALHPRLLAAFGRPEFRALAAELAAINERLADMGAIPMIAL